jgi:4-amino-4-deoxy-L-arabinose transferase-like glycosyltransferase
MQALQELAAAHRRAIVAVTAVACLCWLLFFHKLADRDLWGSHEARAAQDAGSMLHFHDFWLPRLTDETVDLQKPPMYYWLVAATARITGSLDAWSVRFPATMSASLAVFAVAWSLWRRGRPLASLLAAVILATAQHFTWLARTARIDMPLTLCVAIAAIAIGLERRWQVVGFLAIAAAILLKGPIGLVLPLAVIIGDRFMENRLNGSSIGWKSFRWGIPLSLLIAAPWFIEANSLTDGRFFQVFFWHHNFERAIGGSDTLAVHPWWYYGPRLLVDALPWSIPLIPAIVVLFRLGIWRNDREARFGLLWLATVVGILSFAKFKRADYLLPAYPGMAMMLGCLGERVWLASKPLWRRGLASGLAAIIAATIASWIFVIHVELPRVEPQREQMTFARAVRKIASVPAEVLFFRVECHPLAFHLGRRINSLLEWENLNIWAGRPGPTYIIMSPEDFQDWRKYITAGELEEVVRNTDFSGGIHDRPLILMRTRPKGQQNHGTSREQASDRPVTHQHGTAGVQSSRAGRASGTGVGDGAREAEPAVRNPSRG